MGWTDKQPNCCQCKRLKGVKWQIDCSGRFHVFTYSLSETYSPISLLQFHHHSLPPTEQQAWVIYQCPSVCSRVHLCVSNGTNHLDHRGKPKPGWPWLFHQQLILTLSIASSKSSSLNLSSHGFTCICLCVHVCGVPWLGEHVDMSGPVKVTPYASCRDNEGFNFTTHAYQIAAPQSLRHALITWVIWMGRHPPFHVHWVALTEKFAKRPHHHNHCLFQSGLQD